MEKTDEIISDIKVEIAFQETDFGSTPHREVIRNSLLKCACGYYTGHTAKSILIELGLVYKSKWNLTLLGQHYLFAAYSEGISI